MCVLKSGVGGGSTNSEEGEGHERTARNCRLQATGGGMKISHFYCHIFNHVLSTLATRPAIGSCGRLFLLLHIVSHCHLVLVFSGLLVAVLHCLMRERDNRHGFCLCLSWPYIKQALLSV